MKPLDRHKKAPVTESLAASVTRAESIGGKASGKRSDTTNGPIYTIESIASDVPESLRQRPRVIGTLSLWRRS